MFDTNELVINMGPQHPSTHGVLRVVLRLDGEKVVDGDVVIGYLHRGIEKLSENRNWTQIILLTDRMDYVAAATNNVGYCETVEKLMSIEVPRRARYIRTILARAAADREPLPVARHARDGHRRDDGVPLRVSRARADSRSLRGVLRRAAHLQLDAHRRPAARHSARLGQEGARVLRTSWTSKVDEYETLLTHNRIWLERTKGIGVDQRGRSGRARAERSAAARLGRAARRAQGRAVRRLRRNRVRRSDRDRRRHLRSLSRAASRSSASRCASSGRRLDGLARRADRRQGAAAHQAAGGRDVSRDRVAERASSATSSSSDGKSNTPYRFRVRPPSFCNLQALPQLIKGHLVSRTSSRSSDRSTSCSGRLTGDRLPSSFRSSRSSC